MFCNPFFNQELTEQWWNQQFQLLQTLLQVFKFSFVTVGNVIDPLLEDIECRQQLVGRVVNRQFRAGLDPVKDVLHLVAEFLQLREAEETAVSFKTVNLAENVSDRFTVCRVFAPGKQPLLGILQQFIPLLNETEAHLIRDFQLRETAIVKLGGFRCCGFCSGLRDRGCFSGRFFRRSRSATFGGFNRLVQFFRHFVRGGAHGLVGIVTIDKFQRLFGEVTG